MLHFVYYFTSAGFKCPVTNSNTLTDIISQETKSLPLVHKSNQICAHIRICKQWHF